MVLNIVHTLTIKLFNTLPNFSMIFIMICELMLTAPMTKICRKNKKSFFIIKVRSKNFAIIVCHLLIHRTSQNWYNFSFITNCLKDKRQMHFDTVFILFIINVYHMKSLLLLQFIYYLFVHLQRTKRSTIFVDISQSTSWEIFMMRGTKNKYPFNIVRSSNILISPSSSRPAKIKSCMRSDKSFYLFVLHCFFGSVYVLTQLGIELVSFNRLEQYDFYCTTILHEDIGDFASTSTISIQFLQKENIKVIQNYDLIDQRQNLNQPSVHLILKDNSYSQMQHTYKSPNKTTKSSSHLSHYSRSLKAKAPSTSLQASKYKLEIKRQIFHSQAYKTILSKLLSKNSLEEFLGQTSKFVTINDQYSKPYLKNAHLNSKNQRDFPELGRAMLKDGSFIKHYCKLLINKQHQKQQEIKRFFYDKYKNQICQKRGYFDKFFKIELKEQKLSLSQSKAPSVNQDSVYSIKKNPKSSKKIMKDEFLREGEDLVSNNNLEMLSKQVEEQTINSLQVRSNISSIRKKHQIMNKNKSKQKSKTKTQIQQEDQMYYTNYCFRNISNSRNKNQTEEQRQYRMLGYAKKTETKEKSSKGNIIKFVDQIESNKRLRQIYQSIKKQRDEREKNLKSSQQKIQQNRQFSPLLRSSYKKMKKKFEKTQIYDLNNEILNKIDVQQKQLLKYFPNIKKIGIVDKIRKENLTVLGKLKDKLLVKSYIVDYNSCIEPIYIAVYFLQSIHFHQHESLLNNLDISQNFNYSIDETAEVLLVKEFRPQYMQSNQPDLQI